MKRVLQALAGALLVLAPAAAIAAGEPALVLAHLTASDGLPQSSVYTTLQDSQGFIWLATEDGLVRYDGRKLLRYAHSSSGHDGLPGNFIYQILEDAHHDLWLAIKDAGLARWNRASDTFTVYRHDPRDAGSLASDSVRALALDADGSLWVGMNGAGVDVLDPGSGRIRHLRHDPADMDSLQDDRVRSLSLDRSGTLWVGTADGLDRRLPGGRGFSHLRPVAGDAASLSGHEITAVVEDRDGALWVGTFDGGLDRMNREGRVLRSYRHDDHGPDSLSSDSVHTVLQDQAGHLWVGTSTGLDLFDPATDRFHHYRHDPSDAGSLRDSDILSLYEDRAGLVWIGTRGGGVSRWSPRSWEFGGHRPTWLKGQYVLAFADAPGGRIWIGSMGAGLMQFDPASGKATDIDTLLGRTDALGDRRVMSLLRDRRGTLWIGTMGRGLLRLDAEGRLSAIPVKPGDPHAASAAGIMSLFEARDGRIWLGTFGGGANVLDPATGLVRQLPFDGSAGAVSGANVSSIAQDRNGNLWLGTDGAGLNLARPDGRVVRVFRHDPDAAHSLPADAVYGMTADAQGRIWVATDSGGLAQVEGSSAKPDSIRFKAASNDEQLSGHTIYGVLADAGGALWLSGNSGLMRFDPVTGTLRTYHREDGLQGEEFNFGAYARLRDGRLCFGGPGGFNIFDAARVSQNREPPPLVLTRVEILGVPATGGAPYWLRDHLDLDYRQNIVTLDFGALDFTAPARNRIAYRLADLSNQWIDLGNETRLTLTNLGAGDHVLEVRAANSDSVWSGAPLRLTLHQSPAPWRSWWAMTAYVLVALALAAWIMHGYRERFRRVERARRHLESEVAQRTHELVESNRQLAEAVRAKSSFMDRMSHELRTPMNGVVGMIELLSRTALSPAQTRLVNTVRSSSKVLLQIVNDLLDLSKIRAGKLQLEALPLDLPRLLEECAGLFTANASARDIELEVCPPRDGPWPLVGDPLRLQQILMNLISNALKFTTRGKVVVRAEVELAAEGVARVTLQVADTGIGMDADTVARIFQPFTQADESTTRRFGGSGLGLAICRELTDAMGGTISVESRPQAGSCFTVSLTLPLDEAAAPAVAALFETAPVAPGVIGGHVLLVEDGQINAEVAQGYLDALGCTWVWVRTGAEAVARSALEEFDLILMDLSMPAMDGYQATGLIRAREVRRRVPIVALSAHGAATHRDGCLAAGMDDMLSKPCPLADFEQVLRRWIQPRVIDQVTSQATGAVVGTAQARVSGVDDLVNDVVNDLAALDDGTVASLRNLRGGGRPDLYSRLAELFAGSAPELLAQLRLALVAGDLRDAGALCHKLCSSAANVGAMAYSRELRVLEKACAADDAGLAWRQYERLDAALPALLEVLTGQRLRARA